MSGKKKPKKGNQNVHGDIRGNLDFMGMSPRYKFLAIKLIWIHHLNQPENRFKIAIQATPLLKDAYKEGLQALGNYSNKVTPSDTKKCEGSVDIDFTVKNVEVNSEKIYAQACRWDYAIGYDGKIYFIEVHSAETSQVTQVLKKHTWLKDFLVAQAPELNKGDKHFYWIASGRDRIMKNSAYKRRIAQQGITLVGQLNL